MKKHLLFFLLLIVVLFSFGAWQVKATVGGPTFVYDFKYNPVDESVYYIKASYSGRGCPPELMKISLTTGKSDVVFSCGDGEKLSSASLVSSEINKITNNFKPLTLLNLRENKIAIDVNFLNSENYSPELNELLKRNFIASVYQNNKKVTDFTISGCKMEQPFIFAGYAIPGFDKKIVLLSSAVDNCNEGGYIYEALHIIGGVDNLNKNYWSNLHKESSALVPNEGTLVVYEADKINNVGSVNTANDSKEKPEDNFLTFVIVVTSVISILVGVLAGVFVRKLFTKNKPFVG